MDQTAKITDIITPSLESMGYALVLIKLAEGKHTQTLTIMAERTDDKQMGFDDCTEISHVVGTLLEVEDTITSAYNLEVCSPGIDRPLTKKDDYIRYNGYEAKLETQLPIDGRKRFRGTIDGIEGDDITIQMEQKMITIPFSNIRTAKLVLTDELLAAHINKQETA